MPAAGVRRSGRTPLRRCRLESRPESPVASGYWRAPAEPRSPPPCLREVVRADAPRPVAAADLIFAVLGRRHALPLLLRLKQPRAQHLRGGQAAGTRASCGGGTPQLLGSNSLRGGSRATPGRQRRPTAHPGALQLGLTLAATWHRPPCGKRRLHATVTGTAGHAHGWRCLRQGVPWPRPTLSALALFLCWLRSSWMATTSPEGTWVTRTAELVVLTCCPPAPPALPGWAVGGPTWGGVKRGRGAAGSGAVR